MKHAITLISLLLLTISAHGRHEVYDRNVRTLQVTVNGNPFLPPVLKLGKPAYLEISWDEMSHDYHRYTYRIQHCTRDWQPSADLFESDYLYGTNGLPVENYETSFNTTQLYTHYSLTFPNKDASILISGNYKLLVMEDGQEEDGEPAIEVRFRVVEEKTKLTMQVVSNTDMDFNDRHQQVSLQLNYSNLNVTDPYKQIYAVVAQNRRESRTVSGIRPDVNKANGLEWTHCRELIFPAGNEYHKFEILDVNHSGMNVDRMRWFDPYHHAILWTDEVPGSYITTEDHDGAFLPRTESRENNETQAEYVIVHFTLQSPRLPQDVYVNGQWSNGDTDPECIMEYDNETGCYETAVLLKQGYYDYQYITADGSTQRTIGDFWQTENEYQAFIYYKEPGGRYDRIVGYTQLHTRF
ncbi:MAG: DUF5103 domain-containing protein [Bacteroidaceae bacterium]|nr:DUF5103 domain-containing protein [Bacteroidaceae bacterium]